MARSIGRPSRQPYGGNHIYLHAAHGLITGTKKDAKNTTFWDAWKMFIDFKENEQKLDRDSVRKYVTMTNRLRQYELSVLNGASVNTWHPGKRPNPEKVLEVWKKHAKKHLNLSDISPSLDRKFANFLREAPIGNKDENIAKMCEILVTFMHWSNSESKLFTYPDEVIKKMDNAHKPKKPKKNRIVVLTESEIATIDGLRLTDTTLQESLDAFVFMLHTGQRFSEMIRFNRKDISHERDGTPVWDFISHKSNDEVTLPLIGFSARAWDIIKKYDGKLPYAIDFELGMEQIQNRNYGRKKYDKLVGNIESRLNKKINEHLKKIGEIAGIDTTIYKRFSDNGKFVQTEDKPKFAWFSTHMGRRSFITHMLRIGFPIPELLLITGHEDVSTLMGYAGNGDEDVKAALMKTDLPMVA